jgi:SPP1 gp7 family putative phage head morphogenesis protein
MCITCYNDIKNSAENDRLYVLAFLELAKLFDWYWINAGKFDAVSIKQGYSQMVSKMDDQLSWGQPSQMSKPRLDKYTKYKKSLAEFSVKKNFQFTTLASGLKNSGLPKEEFLKEIKAAHEVYYKHWQAVENNQVAKATVAKEQWEQIQEYAEALPYLTYNAINDERVREQHKQLDNITLRFDHPFWEKNMPPNGYNCRCFVTQDFEGEISTLTPEQEAFKPDSGFDKNWAKTDDFFPNNHTYNKSKIEDTEEFQKQVNKLLNE